MEDYSINVTEVEELQMINNRDELERMFARAKSAVVNGASVVLYRASAGGATHKFDEITTEAELEVYRMGVFKYLAE